MKNLANNWNNLTKNDKLEIIEKAIDMCNTNEGFLMLQWYNSTNSFSAFVTTKLDNHLSVEAVSQNTLISLFGENHNFIEEDAQTILNWMDVQK
jgi:hypothetical protein